MDQREAIRFVTSSSVRPAVLRSVSQPTTLNDLTATLPHSRRAISDALDWYESEGWVRNEGNRYVRTAIGSAVSRQLNVQNSRESEILPTASSTKPDSEGGYESREAKREDLKSIIDSEMREQMLRSSSLSTSPSPLSDTYETSAPTAYRIPDSLKSKGWFEKRGSVYHRTTAGDRALSEFEDLRAVIEQLLAHKKCLRWLGPELGSIPIAHLNGARKAVNRPEYTDAAETLFGELVESDFDRYRGMITHVSNSAARKFSPQIQDTVHSELLVTSSVLKNLPTVGTPAKIVRNGLEATNFQTLVAPRLPVSLSIFDDEIVFLCPRPEDVQGDKFGVIVSADEEVVEWAIDLYETYRDQSRRPPEHLIHTLLERLDPSPQLAGLLSD